MKNQETLAILGVSPVDRVLAHGLVQDPLNPFSDLEVDGSGHLIVDGDSVFGSGFGVITRTGEAEGLSTTVDANLSPGAGYRVQAAGVADGENKILSTLDVDNVDGNTRIRVNSGTIGATGFRIISAAPCSSPTSCATSTRTPPSAASTSRARH